MVVLPFGELTSSSKSAFAVCAAWPAIQPSPTNAVAITTRTGYSFHGASLSTTSRGGKENDHVVESRKERARRTVLSVMGDGAVGGCGEQGEREETEKRRDGTEGRKAHRGQKNPGDDSRDRSSQVSQPCAHNRRIRRLNPHQRCALLRRVTWSAIA